MLDFLFDIVKPQSTYDVNRTYRVTEGNKVKCTGSKGEKLFTISFESEEHLQMFMEDLYYGEYTGA